MFCVCHYAGDVNYESGGFLEKNKDRLNEEAYELITNAEMPYVTLISANVLTQS
jgi:myosin heavy subunit